MTFSENVNGIIDDIELSRPYDKAIIKHRFLDEITYYEKKEMKQKDIIIHSVYSNNRKYFTSCIINGSNGSTKLPKHFDRISYWFWLGLFFISYR